MNTLTNNLSDEIIHHQGIRIKGVHCYKDLDLLFVVLNNGKLLQRRLSNFNRLSKASQLSLNNYGLIGGGVGIHWPEADEDLSLKGLLGEEFTSLTTELL